MLRRPGVARFLARRLALVVPTVLLIIVVNFLVLHLTPGDIVDVLAGEAGAATPEYVAMLRQRFGLDRPLATQLASYVWGVVNLDLGFSFRHNTSVAHLMVERLPATLILMGTSLTLAVTLGVQRLYISGNIKKGTPFANAAGYENKDVDAAFAAAQTENDPAKRKELLARTQRLIQEDLPAFNLLELTFVTLYNTKLMNHTMGADGPYGSFKDTYLTP